MNENINLCEILKGHEGESFYCLLYGDIKLIKIEEDEVCPLYFEINRNGDIKVETFLRNGKYDRWCSECIIFPSKDQRDWNKWIEKQKPKISKTWSELCRNNLSKELYASTGNEIKGIDCNDYSVTTNTESAIEKSALALLKIYQLIEHSYGGNVTDEEWKDDELRKWVFVPNKQYSPDDGNNMWEIVYSNGYHGKRNLAFHTVKQAEEFLSYPENVQLLRDYFMV